MELKTLYGMSKSLGIDHLEITPVQVWFELLERFEAEQVLKADSLETLLKELGALVDCHQCGAVMLRFDFEECLRKVLS